MLTNFETKLLNALEPEAQAHDTEIVTLSVVGPKNAPILRIYIDVDGGVSFDELNAAQEWISPVIEKIDPFAGAYTLEVSSPGIDRPLRTLEHFKRFAGEQVHVRIQQPVDERRNFNGKLLGVEGDAVKVETEDGTYLLEIGNIQRANVVAAI